MNGHLQKRLSGIFFGACDNAFTGAHPLRSLMGATMCLLAVLRHIRSLARKQRLVHR
jgi:hypothetical protein